MANTRANSSEVAELDLLQTVTSVYGEIAAMWMKRARTSILDSRQFVNEIQAIFITVFASYTKHIRELAKQQRSRKDGRITFLSHNGKKVAVLISSNTGFYGDIIRQSFDKFLADVKKDQFEAVILGRQGLAMFTAEEPGRPHTFFEFSDERIQKDELIQLVRHLVQYEEIKIYHGKFQTFLNQEAIVDTIAANPYEWMKQLDTAPKPYLFEPNIEAILMFFEKQLFTSLVEQSVRESQLAKFASRIMVMDRAGENIRQRLHDIRTQQLKAAHRVQNQKQVNQYASLSLWQGS